MSSRGPLDVDGLVKQLPKLIEAYRSASPFPHVVVDGLMQLHDLQAVVDEFPPPNDPMWASYKHANERKSANTDMHLWGPTLRELAQALLSDEFVWFLRDLTGLPDLQSDPDLDGGGLHQTRRGGFLNIHADFTTQHQRDDWVRSVNVIVYLNAHWERSWGGALELWDSAVEREVQRIEPVGNRMVVFSTLGPNYHGHPDPLECPEDMARQSLATYYFSQSVIAKTHATRYRARPDDGFRKVAIWADNLLLQSYDRFKRRTGISDRFANWVQGRRHRNRD